MDKFLVNEKSIQLKGEVWMKLGKNLTREQILESPDKNFKNLIVDICSELIAEWAFAGSSDSEHIPGILTLAVGTGDTGWDIQNPPTETSNLTVLYNELTRKAIPSKSYVDSLGNPSNTRTKIIDFMTTFLEGEAVGPLVEMGLFGGIGALNPNSGTRINARHFPVLNKPATSQFSVLWRLTF